VRIFTRRGNDWTNRVPSISQAIGSLPAATATLDGEAVICDEQGISDFDALRAALARRTGSRAAFLYAFDPVGEPPRGTEAPSTQDRRWHPAERAH